MNMVITENTLGRTISDEEPSPIKQLEAQLTINETSQHGED